MSISVILDSVNVTPWVVTEDLDEWLEFSVKGAGWFEWRVKSFDFRLHKDSPVSPTAGQPCTVTIDQHDYASLSGQVGKIDEKNGHVPLLTIDPPALALKDVKAGIQGFDRNGRGQYLLEMENLKLQDAAQAALGSYAYNKPVTFPARAFTAVVVSGGDNPIETIAPHQICTPTTTSAAYQGSNSSTNRSIWALQDIEDFISVKIVDGDIQLGVRSRISQGGFNSASFLEVVFDGHGVGNANTVMPYTRYDVATIADERAIRHDAGLPIQTSSTRVSDARAVAEVQQQRPDIPAESIVIDGYADFTNGSWSFAYADDGETRFYYIIWWSDPLIQYISGRWINRTISELLKLFALVTGHWLKFEGENVIFVPRTGGQTIVTDPDSSLAIDGPDVSDEVNTPPSVTVRTQDPDADEDDREGIDYTVSDIFALNWWYTDRFSEFTESAEAEYMISDYPDQASLLASSESGVWIDLDFSTDGMRFKYKAVQENTDG